MKLQFTAKLLLQKHQNPSGVLASIFSAQTQIKPSLSGTLYDRVRVIRDRKTSVVPILDKWVSEGRRVDKIQLRNLVQVMKYQKRFGHALEISQWMTDRPNFALSPGDIAHRLDMVYRVRGIKLAEEYFNSVPENEKTGKVYGALLSAYVQEKSVQKAENIMQKMREMDFATSTFPYNMLITLYSKIREYNKIEVLVQEIEEKGILKDKKTIGILMSTYVAASNISMMEMVLNWVEKDPHFVADWKIYSIAANGYLKFGVIHKALPMLKKMEEMMLRRKTKLAFEYLLTHWAGIGMKEELYRAWNTYKPQGGEMGSSYACMITCLEKLDDIEGAEKIYKEWVSLCNAVHDKRVLICLLVAYCRKGLFEKAESALEHIQPDASFWNVLATGYKNDNQMPKAVEILKRAVSVGKQGWWPSSETVDACLDYLEGQGDVGGTEDMMGLLKKLGPLKREMYHRWLRTCVAAGASISEVLEQMKLDGFYANEETNKILESRPGTQPSAALC